MRPSVIITCRVISTKRFFYRHVSDDLWLSFIIMRCDSIDLTLIFHANTVATAKHRVFYDSTATAITVMRGNCQVEEHGGNHRDFEKLNAVGECFRQKTRELYCNGLK